MFLLSINLNTAFESMHIFCFLFCISHTFSKFSVVSALWNYADFQRSKCWVKLRLYWEAVTPAISFYTKKGMCSVASRRALEKSCISLVVENKHSLNSFLVVFTFMIHFHLLVYFSAYLHLEGNIFCKCLCSGNCIEKGACISGAVWVQTQAMTCI